MTMVESKLVCTLCDLEVENKILVEDFLKCSINHWHVCFNCRHLQVPPSSKDIWKKLRKRVGSYLHTLLKYKLKRLKPSEQTPLFVKRACTQCQSNDLLIWDGKCTRCGSTFIHKAA